MTAMRRAMGAIVVMAMFMAMMAVSTAFAQVETILEQLKAHSNTRVIVRMKAATEERGWAKATSVSEQRALVREMRSRFDSELSQGDLIIQQAFSSLPFVALEVDR